MSKRAQLLLKLGGNGVQGNKNTKKPRRDKSINDRSTDKGTEKTDCCVPPESPCPSSVECPQWFSDVVDQHCQGPELEDFNQHFRTAKRKLNYDSTRTYKNVTAHGETSNLPASAVAAENCSVSSAMLSPSKKRPRLINTTASEKSAALNIQTKKLEIQDAQNAVRTDYLDDLSNDLISSSALPPPPPKPAPRRQQNITPTSKDTFRQPPIPAPRKKLDGKSDCKTPSCFEKPKPAPRRRCFIDVSSAEATIQENDAEPVEEQIMSPVNSHEEGDTALLSLFGGDCLVLPLDNLDINDEIPLPIEEGETTQNIIIVNQAPTENIPEDDTVEVEQLSTPQELGSRKRMRQPENWKKNQAKIKLDKGEAHFNAKGQFVPAKTMKNGCEQTTCRYKCKEKISEEERRKIFGSFWAIADHTRQWDFIRSNTRVAEPKVHHVEHGHAKMNSRKYFFEVGRKPVKVCRKMFLDTLGITERWCRTAQQKMDSSGVTISPDKRGKHSKVKREVQETNSKNIHDHINLFPRVPSHFCRAKSKRQYLDSSLSIKKMYKAYLEWMPINRANDPIVSEKTYRNVFCTNYNLSFYKPKKDQCQLCSVFRLATDFEKRQLKTKYDEHIKNKDLSRKNKEIDKTYAKSKPSVCCAIFDLQKVLNVPKCESSVLYYKRKLSVYNLSVYDVIRRKGYCYMWTQTEAGRGANEIASCVLEFIKLMVEDEGIKEFLFWSDNCSAQNKNKHLFSMYTHASLKFGVKICHKYLETGHTQNECDSLHANIERASRNLEIFKPSQWYEVVKEAKKDGHPYQVIRMEGKVLNFHDLSINQQKWSNHKEALWKEVREIFVDPEKEGTVFLKHTQDQPNYVEVNVKKQSAGRPINLKNFKFLPAYDGLLQPKRGLLVDLCDMCNSLVIPSEYHDYYKSLPGFPNLTNPILNVPPENEVSDAEEVGDDCLWDDENDEASPHEDLIETILLREEDLEIANKSSASS